MFILTVTIANEKSKKNEEDAIFLKVKDKDFKQLKNVILAFAYGEPSFAKIKEDEIFMDKKAEEGSKNCIA